MFVVKFKKGETFFDCPQGQRDNDNGMSLFEHETDCVPVFSLRVWEEGYPLFHAPGMTAKPFGLRRN